jgi:hypothetical protein
VLLRLVGCDRPHGAQDGAGLGGTDDALQPFVGCTYQLLMVQYLEGPAGKSGALFLTMVLPAPSPVSGAIADSRGSLPMMCLLIGTVSWLGALGFIAAIIADTFR